jgi:hypothetical protein
LDIYTLGTMSIGKADASEDGDIGRRDGYDSLGLFACCPGLDVPDRHGTSDVWCACLGQARFLDPQPNRPQETGDDEWRGDREEKIGFMPL